MREARSSRLPLARRLAPTLALLAAGALLGGCAGNAVLDPAGDVALQQRDIIYISTALMLVIIVPVMALTVVFAWRYHHRNEEATYDPDFDHSTALELVIWAAPLLIVICLGALTWWSTHLLDPFRPLGRVSAEKAIDREAPPLVVQVVSLDWKWLFLYPEQGIATVNELALPVDRQVRFELTSTNMMNTFYAPAMAGMIYTMPGMRSTLHAVVNRPGRYEGMSANYSGAGFSDMRFRLYGVPAGQFDAWVGRVRASGRRLDTATYLRLEQPSEKVAPLYFGGADPALFGRIVNRCVRPNQPCLGEQMGGHHGADPRASDKPKGAIFKQGEEKGEGPNVTKPRAPGRPDPAQPHDDRNRDMSHNHHAAPGTRPAAAA
jgi:cytochrome o ubiquinol oxidase subunit II